MRDGKHSRPVLDSHSQKKGETVITAGGGATAEHIKKKKKNNAPTQM